MINLQTFLAAVFVFGLLITSHEFGHFITAKLSNVKVLEFSLGMGPKLFGFKTKETDYSLRILPIGGYVKMLGEEEQCTDPRAFCNQSPWKRLIIIVAGAFMNFLIAVILFILVAYNLGVVKPIVSSVEAGYPAMSAGVKPNDKILMVNEQKIYTWNQFKEFISENKDKPFKMTVKRDNNIIEINLKPVYNKNEDRYLVGISPKLVKGDLIESIRTGFSETITSIKQMIIFLGKIFKGEFSTNDVGGPVAIVKMSGEAAKVGLWNLLFFAGFLSINLGVFNLIPFPALDGGWVIILLYEAITGKKIDENKIGLINLIGFAILMAFAILVTFKDIIRLSSY
nr:RIP metalloprotease RseP [Caloramator sp. E03]